MKTTTAALLASRAVPVLGANDRINVVVIGFGGRGGDHVDNLAKIPDCRIAAICDVNQAARERGSAQVEKRQGHKPMTYADMRQVFERKDIDAVSIATPNHWHALATIWACQAGKDVYVEKPACHNVCEGRQDGRGRAQVRPHRAGRHRRAAATRDKIRRHASCCASGEHRQGLHGQGLVLQARADRSATSRIEPMPPGVDYDLWLGPAPMQPFTQNRFHYNWHWFWDTGNGDIGNQGVHEMDIARWGLGDGHCPRA